MKKLLGILVVSLLWCNVGFAKEWIFTYKNYYDMTVLGVGYNKNITKSIQMALSECQEQSKKKNLKPEGCLRHDSQKKGAWAELFNQAEKIIVWNKYVDEFEKTLKPEDIIEGRRHKIIRHKSALEKKEEKEKDKISSMIERAKSTCKELGFKEETEKFTDCKLKLYTQEVGAEAAAEAAKSTKQGQTVIVGQRRSGRIYPLHCRQMGGASDC